MHLQNLFSSIVILMVVALNGAWGRQWELVRGAPVEDRTHVDYKADCPETGSKTIGKDTEQASKTENSENDFPVVLTLTKNPKNSEAKETDPGVSSEAVNANKEGSHYKKRGVITLIEDSKYVPTIPKSTDDVPKSAKIDDAKKPAIGEEKVEGNADGDTSSGEGISDEDISDENNSEEEPNEVTEINIDEITEPTEAGVTEGEYEGEKSYDDSDKDEESDEDPAEDEKSSEDHTENEEPSEDHTELSNNVTNQNKSKELGDSDELLKQLQEDDVHLLKPHSKRHVEDQLIESDGELGSGEILPFEGTTAKDESEDLNPGSPPAVPEDDDVSDEATDSGFKQSSKPRRVVQQIN